MKVRFASGCLAFGVPPLALDKALELRRSRISGAREIKIEAIINFGID